MKLSLPFIKKISLSRRGSMVEVMIWYVVALFFLFGFYLVFSLYFNVKPISIFVGIFAFLTFLLLIGLLRELLRKKGKKKK